MRFFSRLCRRRKRRRIISEKLMETSHDNGGNIDTGLPNFPPEIMTQIMSFLPQTDIIHKASLVNSNWNEIVKHPQLWRSLPSSLFNTATISSLELLVQLLERPQFSKLARLNLPNWTTRCPKESLEHLWTRLSIACPLINGLSGSYNVHITPEEVTYYLPICFHRLCRLKIRLASTVTENTFLQGVKSFQGRLSSLILVSERMHFLSGSSLLEIAECCPRLEQFGYLDLGMTSPRITVATIIQFIQSCQNLEFLYLFSCHCSFLKELSDWWQSHRQSYPNLKCTIQSLTGGLPPQ